MNVRVVTMSLGGQQSQFSGEAELNAALSRPGVISVEKQFFMTDGVARYAFLITYDESSAGTEANGSPEGGRARSFDRAQETRSFGSRRERRKFPTQDEVLKAVPIARRHVFDEIREFRNKAATAAGIKGYLLANNYQLAHIVCLAPQTLDALKKVKELGENFCASCGAFVLERMKGLEPMGLDAPADAWWSLENCYGEGDDGGRGATALPGDGGTDADATSASLPADATSASLPAGEKRPGTDAMDCTPPGRAVAPRPPQDDAEGTE